MFSKARARILDIVRTERSFPVKSESPTCSEKYRDTRAYILRISIYRFKTSVFGDCFPAKTSMLPRAVAHVTNVLYMQLYCMAIS